MSGHKKHDKGNVQELRNLSSPIMCLTFSDKNFPQAQSGEMIKTRKTGKQKATWMDFC